jgi:7-cyano-7-deazaguanine reductase
VPDLRATGAGAVPDRDLETFPNPAPDHDYTIRIRIPEFTCLCPRTGQPDFAEILIEYVPDERCIELKSLKLYMWSFRDEGTFHEAVTNQMLAELRARLDPRFLRIRADFNVRGGIYTSVVAEHRKSGWNSPSPVELP